MKFLALLLALLTFGCAGVEQARQERVDRIAGLQHGTVAFVERDPSDFALFAYCSGVWLEERLILTAAHCVADTDNVEYATFGAVTVDSVFPFALPATVVRRDTFLDLALVVVTDKTPPPHAIIKLAADAPRLGDQLHIVGHTAGLPWSYTPAWLGALRSEVFDRKVPVLQFFSGMGPGNSGGGVFNADGELLGICRSGLTATHGRPSPPIGFAVRASAIRKFLGAS